MNKIRSYTLLELIVVMLLTGLIIALTFSAYRVIVRQYLHFKARQQVMYEQVLLKRLLDMDFSEALSVSRSTDGILFTYPDKTTHYIFDTEYVLRKDQLTDTFHIACRYRLWWNGEEVVDNQLADKLILYNGQDRSEMEFSKKYGADQLMRQELVNRNPNEWY